MSAGNTPSNRDGVAVLGWGLFAPEFAGQASLEDAPPTAAIVPARTRRRASVLSKALADAFATALERARFEPSEVATVFGSALGEATTMIGLLDQMWDEQAMLSPMKFATSVHNAASGVISIATGNRGFTTSLGADFDTPAMALLEGIGLVRAEGRSVIVCCGDEAPPSDLVPEGLGWSMLCAAVALAPIDAAQTRGQTAGQAARPILSDFGFGKATLPAAPASASMARNPNVGLLDLVVALEAGVDGVVALDRGAGRGFTLRLEAGAVSEERGDD